MDEQVLAAMARWPNVPDVYGWLSLSSRGLWCLHPGGHGTDPADPGEAITSPQIRAFIGHNYACDSRGRWYFQNGPQRVYVRLDAAPWILFTSPDEAGALQLVTQTEQPYGPVTHWWLDDEGHLYAQADQGAGLVDGRDLPRWLEQLQTLDGPLLDWLERENALPDTDLHVRCTGCAWVPLRQVLCTQIEAHAGFVRNPQPEAKIPA